MTTQLLSLPGMVEAVSTVQPQRVPARRMLRARYDAAQTTDENRRHWANADSLSARAAADPSVRRTLRIRARYEFANCPLANGILQKWANFVVGTGPRVQIKTKSAAYNAFVQERFVEWAVASKFYRKLWMIPRDDVLNGETFGLWFSNPGLRSDDMPVTLDIRQIEADQVADPAMVSIETDDGGDGIVFDDYGNVIGYRVLDAHPGDAFDLSVLPNDFETYSADDMYHYFTAERIGQVRGVTKLASSLPYFANRRRFMMATLLAAEVAAVHAGVFQSANPDPDDDTVADPFESIELDRGMFTTLPEGYSLNQLKAEHPATTFEMFDLVLVKEIARPLNMPYTIAAGDSSQVNFASGKLDHLPFWRGIAIEQEHLEDAVVDRTFVKWFAEAVRIPGYLPPSPLEKPRKAPPRDWFWDGQELLDPREAGATDTGLKNGSLTYPSVYAKKGKDIDTEWAADAAAMGISLDEYRTKVMEQRWPVKAAPVAGAPAAQPDKPDDAEDEDDE